MKAKQRTRANTDRKLPFLCMQRENVAFLLVKTLSVDRTFSVRPLTLLTHVYMLRID